jgi:hypothetical protein
MAAIVYPPALPVPSTWTIAGPDRRASSPPSGNVTHRARWRDRIVNIDAAWFYTPSEMTEWRAWYEDVLLDGQYWFAVSAPGPGGFQTRVCKFRTQTVKREALGAGNYKVSAQLQQRGVGVVPEEPLPTLGPWKFNGPTTSLCGLAESGFIYATAHEAVEARLPTWDVCYSGLPPGSGTLNWFFIETLTQVLPDRQFITDHDGIVPVQYQWNGAGQQGSVAALNY